MTCIIFVVFDRHRVAAHRIRSILASGPGCCLISCMIIRLNLFLFHFSREIDLEKKFEPSLINSTVYIISVALQISTFAVNYRVSFNGFFGFFSNTFPCHLVCIDFLSVPTLPWQKIQLLIISSVLFSPQGHPFMESLRENKPLLYSVCGSAFVIFSLAAGWLPDLAAQFEIIDFPPEVSSSVLIQ